MRQEIIAARLHPIQAKVILPEGKTANASDFVSNGKVGTSKANTWNVSIRYEYAVNGKSYYGYLASLDGNSFRTEMEARNSLKGLVGDGTIAVWYDKQRPNVAVLDPKQSRSGYKAAIICLLLAAFANLYLDQMWYRLRKKM